MKLATYELDGRRGVAVLTDKGLIPTAHRDMLELIRSGAAVEVEEGAGVLEGAKLLAPVPHPGKVLCTGLNYASHKEENPSAVFPEEPYFFVKLPTAYAGPGDAIRIPQPSSQVDYEVELSVVIGRGGRGIEKADALGHIFGYTIVNDVSARDIQFKDNGLTLGKGLDTFCPIGPVILTADEVPDYRRLHVASYVNGERRQYAPASDMLFDIPSLIEHVSRDVTLEPGDILTTGTPAGVGTFMKPPSFLEPGDVVEVEVEGVGRLRNHCVAGWER